MPNILKEKKNLSTNAVHESPQNILLYEYLKMQYIKIKIRPSTFNLRDEQLTASMSFSTARWIILDSYDQF